MTSVRIGSCSSWSTAASAAIALAALLVAAPAGSESYRIGPGDVVDVQVWRESDISGPHEIDEAGLLRHVLVGPVPAQGLTCEELAATLRTLLEKDFLRSARVTVTLEASARRKAWILGAVERPGSYPVDEQLRLLDLVFAAGGAAEGAGSARISRMGEPEPGEDPEARTQREPLAELDVDLAALLSGDLAANHRIEAGDVVVVSVAPGAVAAPAGAARIRIVGEVENPGSYGLHESPTALDAVLTAGGFTEYASANRARLVREGVEGRVERKIRLDDIVHGRKGAENVELEDGDLIVVPESFF